MKALFGTTAAVVFASALLAIPGQARPIDADVAVAEAPEEARGHARHRKGLVDRWAEKLELSDAQVETLTAMQADHKATARPLREEMKEARQGMKALWQAEVLDADAILAQQAEIHELKGAIAQARLGFKLDAMAVLDADQQAQVKERMAQRGERKRRRGKGKRGARVRSAD